MKKQQNINIPLECITFQKREFWLDQRSRAWRCAGQKYTKLSINHKTLQKMTEQIIKHQTPHIYLVMCR